LAFACGGNNTPGPSGTGDSTGGSNSGGGGGKRMTVTYNGSAYSPNLLTSGFSGGQVVVGASDGTRTFNLSGLNATTGVAYPVGPGVTTMLVTWVDGVGQFASGVTGGSGTVTFTILQLGRVAGSMDVSVGNKDQSGSIIRLQGTFDIPFP
jgi:hypothetical protein